MKMNELDSALHATTRQSSSGMQSGNRNCFCFMLWLGMVVLRMRDIVLCKHACWRPARPCHVVDDSSIVTTRTSWVLLIVRWVWEWALDFYLAKSRDESTVGTFVFCVAFVVFSVNGVRWFLVDCIIDERWVWECALDFYLAKSPWWVDGWNLCFLRCVCGMFCKWWSLIFGGLSNWWTLSLRMCVGFLSSKMAVMSRRLEPLFFALRFW
jgi:hypothetical protein